MVALYVRSSLGCSERRSVHAGRRFWSWINYGEDQTQDWMMTAILEAVDEFQAENPDIDELGARFRRAFVENYGQHITAAGDIDWTGILDEING